MKVELVDIDRVIPYARNPRKNEAAVAKVMASIKEYGFRQSIIVSEEMVIIAGQGSDVYLYVLLRVTYLV